MQQVDLFTKETKEDKAIDNPMRFWYRDKGKYVRMGGRDPKSN